jgi:hypothetical protein
LADQQNAVLHKLNYLEKRITSLQSSKAELALNSKSKQDKINEKIGENQAKWRSLMSEKE